MEYKNNLNLPINSECTICVIGLGYVGLPLATEFNKRKKSLLSGKKLSRKIVGFDLNKQRITELQSGQDTTMETDHDDLIYLKSIKFTNNPLYLRECEVFIISVPTPIDINKIPDLNYLEKATKTVAEIISTKQSKFSPIIIYESTVYPGTTEEICVPILEKYSGLRFNNDFYCGYSPERINPGDKEHRLTSIVKITSGSNNEVAMWIDELYGSIIEAGTYKAKSIKIAEAAKVIENTQRDLNIALVNELAKICKTLKIDTLDVLDAAGSKWNFLPFKPGLVGGHCISVDPYYLTYKSKQHGYNPDIVLAGRNLNDSMSEWIVEQLIKEIFDKEITLKKARVLILGITFKENCPDTRNSKVLDIIDNLNKNDIVPYLYDPYIINKDKLKFNFKLLDKLPLNEEDKFDVVIVAVPHKEFKDMDRLLWSKLVKDKNIIYDLKGIVPRELNSMRL